LIPLSELTFEAIAFSLVRSRALSMTQKVSAALETLPAAGAVPLESILCTEKLRRRPSHSAEFEKENSALVSLVSALADSPRTILQTLANKVLEVLRADSAGISLLTKDETRFYWAAISGSWGRHVGGGTPRTFGPCGDVLDHNAPMLFSHWELRYPYLSSAMPLAEEGLLVPFYVNGKAVGTIWAIAHDKRRQFDAEDLRLLESMGRFASAAYQAVESIESLNWEIAAREKAEAEVRELASGLEAKIRRLVNANIIGICIWNVEGRIIEANEAFLRIVGYDREDLLLGQVSWREVTPDKWRAADEQALAQLAATGVCEPFEKEYFRKDGSRVPVLVGGALLEGSGSDGVAFVLDLSEHKHAEDALRASEASLREAQRLTRTCSWRHDVLSDKVTVSPEGFLMYGIEPEDDASSADFYFRRMHPKDRPEFEQAYAAALLRKTDFEADVQIVLPDGTVKNIRSIGHPILDERGDVVEFVGAAIDVTEHHRAAQALRRSEAYLAEAQRLTKTGSWAMDPRADRVLYLSQETYRIFGFNPADGIPSIERFWQRVHPDDRTRVRARIEEGVRDKVEVSFEYRITLPDGSVKYLRNLRRPVINDAGEVVEVIGTTMDITEHKQAEEAKKAAEELASSHVEVMIRSLDVLAKEPAPEKYIAEILRTIGQHLRAHRIMLWLCEQNDDSLRLHTVILNDKPIVTDETDHPFVRTSSSWKQIPFLTGMLATKSTAVCEDVEDDSRLTSEWRKYLMSRKTKRLVSVPMFLAGEFRGFISIHHSEAGAYRPDEIELAQSLAQHVMMAVHGQQVAEQERKAAILKERARLARDVHDTLAQGFTGVILQMEAAEEALFDENPDAAVQRVRRAREIARESLGEARRSVHALRPQALDKSGFAEALQSMLKNTTAGTSLRTSFCSEGEPMVLPANVEETLLRIGQEALSNALKHAHPTEFHIRLCFKSDAVRLELFDNGKGFVVGQTNGGVGLLGMKERAEQIGATLTISSEPGKGTKIIAVSPNKVETASS